VHRGTGSRSSGGERPSRKAPTTPRRMYDEEDYEEDEENYEDRAPVRDEFDMFDEEEEGMEENYEEEEEEEQEEIRPTKRISRKSGGPPPSRPTKSRASGRGSSSRARREDYYDEEEEMDYPPPRRGSAAGRKAPPPRKGPAGRYPPSSIPRRGKPPPRRGGRSSGGAMVPYVSNAAGAFTRGLTALKDYIPDPNVVKDSALKAVSAASQTTSTLSKGFYREIKGLTSSELEQVMLKATRPDDSPVKGKHVERLVGVTYQISARYDIYDAVLRKLWKKMIEADWRTKIKALYILHRFSSDGALDHGPALKVSKVAVYVDRRAWCRGNS